MKLWVTPPLRPDLMSDERAVWLRLPWRRDKATVPMKICLRTLIAGWGRDMGIFLSAPMWARA